VSGEHPASHGAEQAQSSNEEKGSISLSSAVAMGTGVMIGAGIFALTGQIAQLAGPLFPLSFVAGAVVTALAAYSYIKMSNAWPSSGGIAMILKKAYGPGTIAASASLLMALSMVINESLVARTFATYALRPFGLETNGIMLAALALALIVFAYLVNAAGNRSVSALSIVMSAIKIGGIAIFAVAAIWASGLGGGAFAEPVAGLDGSGFDGAGFIASIAFSILAFKGFTTITNSGGEIVDPHRNVGRTIMIAIGICVVTYLLVAVAVGSSLDIGEIVAARDYSLAAAAKPALGQIGFWFTIVIAVTATASGVVASVFAVSRMLTMLTEMKMIPHSHFGMKGTLRSHLLVYTVVVAGTLAVLFDLTRIAALGAFFYLVMDMLVHWGVLRHLRREIGARAEILLAAIAADAVVLAAFTWIKLRSDPAIVAYAALGIVLVFAGEHWFFNRKEPATRNPG
jgi:amino acid transporter